MEKPDIKNNWHRWKHKVKEQYPNLSDEDLEYEIDKEEDLLERLQEKTRKTKKEIYNWLHLMG